MKSGLNEIELQKIIHSLISDPSVIRLTVGGKRIQILSPGEINVHEGPDFLDVGILLDGYVLVGDAEFHKKSSDWINHNHTNDDNYKNVILHIVNKNDTNLDNNFETLVISESELTEIVTDDSIKNNNLDSIEDLQHYSLVRLLRKSSEAQKLINKFNILDTYEKLTEEYLIKYNNRRKRPVYNINDLKNLILNLKNSESFTFLNLLNSGESINISDKIYMLMRSKIHQEGAHLRREIILNCLLPIAICLANEEARINLFLWYWSTPSLHTYGVLSRKYKDMPQNFLWQQQGLLEYMKEFGKKTNMVREAVRNYGFAEVLSFYRLGRAPFRQQTDED